MDKKPLFNSSKEYVRLDTQVVKVGTKKFTFLRAFPQRVDADGASLSPVLTNVVAKDGTTKEVPLRINAKLSFDAQQKLFAKGGKYPFIVEFNNKVVSEFPLKDNTGALLLDEKQQPRTIMAHQYSIRRAVDKDGAYKFDNEGKPIKFIYINDFDSAEPTDRPVSDVSLDMLG